MRANLPSSILAELSKEVERRKAALQQHHPTAERIREAEDNSLSARQGEQRAKVDLDAATAKLQEATAKVEASQLRLQAAASKAEERALALRGLRQAAATEAAEVAELTAASVGQPTAEGVLEQIGRLQVPPEVAKLLETYQRTTRAPPAAASPFAEASPQAQQPVPTASSPFAAALTATPTAETATAKFRPSRRQCRAL